MKNSSPAVPRFPLGPTFLSCGVNALFDEGKIMPGILLQRHQCGDWGEICAEDHQVNEDALKYGNRILSAYSLADGTKVWVITEADRSATTILLPSEY